MSKPRVRAIRQPTFRVKVTPSPIALARLIKDLPKEFQDWRPAWEEMADALTIGIRDNFTGGGSALGVSWKRLDREYAKTKGGGKADLILSRTLKNAVTDPARVKFTKTKFALGVLGGKVPYARAQQKGTPPAGATGQRTRGIPARPFMGWNERMKNSASEIMARRAEDLLRKMAAELRKRDAARSGGT